MAVRTFTVLRLPRALMGLVGGFGLGVAGFVYQTVFRNPLASPDIIGVSFLSPPHRRLPRSSRLSADFSQSVCPLDSPPFPQ
mgnify:CR=1 FL=1